MFAGGLDFSLPVKKFFYDPLGSGRAFVNCVVSLTGFALVGGPARQDAPKAVTALKKLNVPYLVSLPLVFQTTEEWLSSELGVHPVQVALQVRPLTSPTHPRTGTAGRNLLPAVPVLGYNTSSYMFQNPRAICSTARMLSTSARETCLMILVSLAWITLACHTGLDDGE